MKVCSLNVRGLGDRIKRRAVFQYFREKTDMDVIFLQEIHVQSTEQCCMWKTEWGGPLYASIGESNSRGVITLINPNSRLGIKMTNIKRDSNGRLLVGEAQVENKTVILCNIYAPNEDDTVFFTGMIRTVESFTRTDCVIIGGDFNLVMNPPQDRNNSLHNHVASQEILADYVDHTAMTDIWRVLHPDCRRYTWHRGGGSTRRLQASRIDFFLIPQWLTDCVQQCEIEPGFMTDHSLVTLTIGIEEFKWGAGVWRFNNKLLEMLSLMPKWKYFYVKLYKIRKGTIHVKAGKLLRWRPPPLQKNSRRRRPEQKDVKLNN